MLKRYERYDRQFCIGVEFFIGVVTLGVAIWFIVAIPGLPSGEQVVSVIMALIAAGGSGEAFHTMWVLWKAVN